jgi:predicted nuclease with RNAse H fold
MIIGADDVEKTMTTKPLPPSQRKRRKPGCVLGIDLGGVEHRPTGVCILRGSRAETRLVYTDHEILELVKKAKPALAAIDAPLTLPPGRRSMEERTDRHLRPADEELLRRRIPFFPITLGPMRVLTVRGIGLKRKIRRLGVRAVEIYPGGAQDIWRLPRAKRNIRGLRRGLEKLGMKGLRQDACAHELDAASGALVGRLYLQGKAEVYGDFKSGAILMPFSRPRQFF